MFKHSMQLLNKRDKSKFFFSCLIQSSLAFLDLMGVLIFGLIAMSGANTLGLSAGSKFVEDFNRKLNLSNVSEIVYTVGMTGLASIFFIIKSILAMHHSRKVFQQLAKYQFDL